MCALKKIDNKCVGNANISKQCNDKTYQNAELISPTVNTFKSNQTCTKNLNLRLNCNIKLSIQG